MLTQLLLISAVLTWALVEVVNHGEILLDVRLVTYRWAESWKSRIVRFLLIPLRSLGCPYCFSHWAALGASFAVVFAAGERWWWAPILWLPATRLANLANDLTHGVCRTPGRQGLSRQMKDASPQELEMRLIELLGDSYNPTKVENEEKD